MRNWFLKKRKVSNLVVVSGRVSFLLLVRANVVFLFHFDQGSFWFCGFIVPSRDLEISSLNVKVSFDLSWVMSLLIECELSWVSVGCFFCCCRFGCLDRGAASCRLGFPRSTAAQKWCSFELVFVIIIIDVVVVIVIVVSPWRDGRGCAPFCFILFKQDLRERT